MHHTEKWMRHVQKRKNAYLSRNLGKPHFEQHIPAAIANLTEVCAEGEALEELRTLFASGL
jgi:hypothetical protein